MRGLIVDEGGLAYREDLTPPEERAGEVRVRVLKAGVCATDLALARGYMDFRGIPGHEFVGVALDGPLAGQRVVGEINAACGACPACRADLGRHCAGRSVLGILGRPGAFAEELSLPAANLFAVPDGVDDEAAVFTEPLAAAFEIADQVALEPGMRGLVAGDGRLGLLCARVLALHGLEVVVAGRHPEHAELLPAGARHVTGLLEPGSPGSPDSPGNRGRRPEYDIVVEATGNPAVLEAALECVRPRGTLVLKTTSEERVELDLAPIVIHEIQVVGSRCGRFPVALEALAAGDVSVEGLVHGRLPLSEGVGALTRAAAPGTLKILIEIPA